MVTIRYYATDILTGEELGDIELYGVFASRQIGRGGNWTGTAKFKNKKLDDELLDQITKPGRTEIHIERDGVDIWGGYIWSRTYNPQSQAFSMTGQAYESYFDHVVFENHFIQEKIAQETIFVNMVNQLQADAVDANFTFGTLPTSGVLRTVLIPGYEFHFATDALTQITENDNGLEYTIGPDKVIQLGYPQLGNSAADDIGFDFPGAISNYWLPESAANAGVKFAALGYGSGNKIARATATRQDLIDAGYPEWWLVKQYSTIADLTLLQDKVGRDAMRYGMPAIKPTFEIKPSQIPSFDGWDRLGDPFKAHIQDIRFPAGFEIESRLIGWEWNPPTSDSTEMLRLVIEGDDL